MPPQARLNEPFSLHSAQHSVVFVCCSISVLGFASTAGRRTMDCTRVHEITQATPTMPPHKRTPTPRGRRDSSLPASSTAALGRTTALSGDGTHDVASRRSRLARALDLAAHVRGLLNPPPRRDERFAALDGFRALLFLWSEILQERLVARCSSAWAPQVSI